MYELPKAKNSDLRSFAFVTMHKAGSSIADRIFRVYAKHAGLVPANLAERAKAVGAPEGEFCRDNADKLRAKGYYFGPFRGVYVADMGGFRDNRLVVQMRDPRDCICSHYFSMGWSHRLPKTQERQAHFLRMRDEVQSQEIDEYAINTTHQYLRRMEVIRDIIDAHNDVLLLSYETMVTDTPAWCAQIESFFAIERTPRLNRALRGLLDFNVDSEDASKHKRQVTPGDHKRKLLPETLEKMNETLQPVLDRFSYAP